MSLEHVETLLSPSSVAVFGATERPGAIGAAVFAQMMTTGFAGPLWAVNPKHQSVRGLPCFPDAAALPDTPSLAVIASPPRTVAGVLDAVGERGCRAALILTPGIERGGPLMSEILQAARRHGLRFIGPHSAGLLRPPRLLAASTAPKVPLSGRLAFLSQSGSIIGGVIAWAVSREIGFSHVVSVGDQADVTMADLLDHLATDRESRAILLYLEGIDDAQSFMPAARAAARVKPVIALKSGRRREGAVAANSHSGALAGTDALFDAALARAGILRIDTIEELFDAAEALDHLRLRAGQPLGDRIGIVTNGGGAGVLAADAVGDIGARLAVLGDETQAKIAEVLPAFNSPANPVDLDAGADGMRYGTALAAILADPDVDATVVLHSPTALGDGPEAARAVVEAASAHRKKSYRAKPVFACWLGDDGIAGQGAEAQRALEEADIPCFATPTEAVRGFGYLLARTRLLDEISAVPPAAPAGPEADWVTARAVIRRAAQRGSRRLNEAEAKAVLAAAGIPTVPTAAAVPDPDAARTVAETLARQGVRRFALKALSDDLEHKSDVGGVILDLDGPDAVAEAATRMLADLAQRAPDAKITGLSVQETVRRPEAHELLCGLSDDPVFGPAILFGAGGLAVEAADDIAMALPPLDMGLARRLIERTRVARLLAGYRMRPRADLDAIAAVLVRLGEMARALPMICELDINPLLADDVGAVALDARIIISRRLAEAPAPNPRFAIRPYPAELEGRLALGDGTTAFCRPVKPEDAPRFAEFFAKATPEDLRLRFFSRMNEVPPGMIARLTQIDYARAIAFVAFAPSPPDMPDDAGEMLGVGRLATEASGEEAEFSVMVRSDLKGRGLGRALMERLIAHARAEGIGTIWGDVLTENEGMLALAARLGFRRDAVPGEGVIHVALTVD
ncbi:MAG: GNAT family N-acetyltransferase [Pseudomonadota bacterium]